MLLSAILLQAATISWGPVAGAIGAAIAGILFFWVCGKDFVRQQVDMGAKKKLGNWFEFASKYIFCGLTIAVLVFGTLLGGIG